MKIGQFISQITGFDWDEANQWKNWLKHSVNTGEAEQVFFNQPLLILPDEKHSGNEFRWYCLGQTNQGTKLFISVTIRKKLIRIISARKMSIKEKRIYAQS